MTIRISCRTSLQTLALTAGGLLTQPGNLFALQQPAPKKLGIALGGLLLLRRPPLHYQQTAQMDAFVQAIQTKTKPEASGEEGWKDMKLIGAILQAADTGRKIQLSGSN